MLLKEKTLFLLYDLHKKNIFSSNNWLSFYSATNSYEFLITPNAGAW